VNNYDVGDEVRVTGTFTDSAGTEQDPNAVFFQYEDPSGTVTALAYPADAALVKDDTGIYHVDIDVDEAGMWHWRWYSTGVGQAADEGQFLAEDSRFV
jgi:hypothetical protein